MAANLKIKLMRVSGNCDKVVLPVIYSSKEGDILHSRQNFSQKSFQMLPSENVSMLNVLVDRCEPRPSKFPIAGFEMGRFAELAPAFLGPFHHGIDQLARRDMWASQKFVARVRVA